MEKNKWGTSRNSAIFKECWLVTCFWKKIMQLGPEWLRIGSTFYYKKIEGTGKGRYQMWFCFIRPINSFLIKQPWERLLATAHGHSLLPSNPGHVIHYCPHWRATCQMAWRMTHKLCDVHVVTILASFLVQRWSSYSFLWKSGQHLHQQF